MSCKCALSCTTEKCTCVKIGLSCTPACKLQNCENMLRVDEEDHFVQDGDDNESDED